MLGKLFRAVVDVALIPVAVVKDAVTLGGQITDQEKCYTAQKIDDIEEDLDEVI